MNNDIQVMDIIESLKEQIAELAYQVSYRDGVIKSQERQIEELTKHLEPVEAVKDNEYAVR